MKKSYHQVLLLLFLLLLGGCGRKEEAAPALWVVTEQSESDGMNWQAEQIVKAFQAEHPDVAVTLDILPAESVQRELRLKRLRTQIMAGKGPDVYLLPSCNIITYPEKSWRVSSYLTLKNQVEPLFSDPRQAMGNGVFLDISTYYDRDEALETEQLQQTVMDAGVLDGARCLLPLRYDFPVLFLDTEGVRALGVEPESLTGSGIELMEAALRLGQPLFAGGAEPSFCRLGRGFSLLPPVLDYENGAVCLTETDLSSFLKTYQALEILAAGNHDNRYGPGLITYIQHEKEDPASTGDIPKMLEADIFPRDVPITVGTLSLAPCAAAIAQVEKREVEMVPLRSADGAVVAEVTYYGAVGAGCENPDLAYDFLRRFLLEENQWERSRPLKQDSIKNVELQYHPIADGWPVRCRGWIEEAWKNLRNGVSGYRSTLEKSFRRSKRIMGICLTEEDIPLLDVQIDRVSFGHTLEQQLAALLRELEEGEKTDAELDTLAAQFLRELKWQLMEG